MFPYFEISTQSYIRDTLKANNAAVNTHEKKSSLKAAFGNAKLVFIEKVQTDCLSSWKCHFKCKQPTEITLNKFDTMTEEILQACSLRQHCNRAEGKSALQTWDLKETLEFHYQFYSLKENKFTWKFSRVI